MAQLSVTFKVITPDKLQVDKIRKKIWVALETEANIQNRGLNTSITTWRHEKPTFKSEVKIIGRDAVARTGLSGSEKGKKKWQWLSKGTKTRWAVMSGNWKSKTSPSPGRFKSAAGRGHPVIIGKRRMKRPMPGIKARAWPEKMQNRRKNLFPKKMKRIMAEGAKNAF